MKSYNHLFEKVISIDNIKKAIDKASIGKRSRDDVVRVMSDIDEEAKKIREMLLNDEYRPSFKKVHVINEQNNLKVREIRKPHFAYDQIVHHAVIQVMEPIFLKGMYEYVCGSVPKRGAHAGSKRIKKWLMNDVKNTRYCMKCDIRHFYASVDQEILKEKLQKKIRDGKMLNLLNRIIDSCPEGIPLGYYTSQWFGNYLLQDMDHYIKQELKAKYYLRYMDDIVIFGSNKKELHRIRAAVERFMAVNLHLKMKDNWQIFRIEYTKNRNNTEKVVGRKLDFMGFLFNHEHVTLRKRGLINVTRKAARVSKKEKINWYDATAMLSHLGKLKCTETRNIYEKWIKPRINVKELKRIVSKHQRKENELERIRMENARGLSGGTAA